MKRERISGRTIQIGSLWIETIMVDGKLDGISLWRKTGRVLVKRWERS